MPRIVAFSVDPDYVGAGETVDVAWATWGGTEIRLEQNGVSLVVDQHLTTGTLPLVIASTSRLDLVVFNEAGDFVSESLNVGVGLPEILSFTAAPSDAWPGSTITFEWETRGASVLVISDGEGADVCTTALRADVAQGSCSAVVPEEGIVPFVLEVRNASSQIATQTRSVSVRSGPSISSFSISPANLLTGSMVTVAWDVFADPDGEEPNLTLSADRGGPYTLPGGSSGTSQFLLSELGAYQFTLTATTSSPASIPATASRTTQVFGPATVTLVANPSMFDIDLADEVALSWTSTNAASLVLYRLDGSGNQVQLVDVAAADRASGSFSIAPTAATTYRIVATNGLGTTVSAEATVTLPPTQILSFTATPTAILAGDEVMLEWTTKAAQSVSLDFLGDWAITKKNSDPFLDAAASGGTKLPLSSCNSTFPDPNDGCGVLDFPIGFTFPFGGVLQTQIKVFAKGVASFDLAKTNIPISGSQFPVSTQAWAHLGVFWADQIFPSSVTNGNVWWDEGSDAVGRYVVIQWKGNTFYTSGPDSLNYEIILRESGEFEYRYGTMLGRDASRQDKADGGGVSIGFQTPGGGQSGVLHYSSSTTAKFPGGLQNRSFGFKEASSLDVNGSYAWHPVGTGTKTATLTASGNGLDSAPVSVTIHPRTSLTVAAPASSLVGQTFTISWTSQGATAVEVVDELDVVRCTATSAQLAAGSCQLSESSTGTFSYTVRASGALNQLVEKEIEVAVAPPDFGITTFESDEATVDWGASVVLSWVTGFADSLTLTANGVDVPLPANVNVDEDSITLPLAEGTTFVLTATSANFGTKQATTTVAVRTFIWDFEASELDVRPGTPVTLSWTGTSLVPGQNVEFLISGMTDISATAVYEDISATSGAPLYARGTSASSPSWVTVDLPAGFTFPYFGQSYDKVVVGHQGAISFDRTISGWFYAPKEFPDASTTEYGKVALAPFWGDIQVASATSVHTTGGIYTKFIADPVEGDHFIIQYHHMRIWNTADTTDFNFQVVLFADGAYEFRFANMLPLTGNSQAQGTQKTIGYQKPGGAEGYNVHFGGTTSSGPAFPGGLSNKAWRWAAQAGNGTRIVIPSSTTPYSMCAKLNGYQECKTITVTADFKIDSFELSESSINAGQPVTLGWVTKGSSSMTLTGNGVVLGNETNLGETDQVTLVPDATTSYVLEIKSLGRTLTQTRTVEVKQFLVAASASDSDVAPGDAVNISWTVSSFNPANTPVMLTPMEEVASPFYDISTETGVATIFAAAKDNEIVEHVFPVGFEFPYLGTSQTKVRVGVNGFLSFDATIPATGLGSNTAIPSTDSSNKRVHLAPFWDDLHTRSSGRVYAAEVGSDYIIQWSQVSPLNGSSNTNEFSLNFQVVLHPDGSFEYRYGTMGPPASTSASCYPNTCVNESNGSSATIGYQHPSGTAGFLAHFGGTSNGASNRPFVGGLAGRALKFTQQSGNGSVTVHPTDNSTYKICALYAQSIECADPIPVTSDWKIDSFSATPGSVQSGQPVTLAWVTLNPTAIPIKAVTDGVERDIDVSALDPANGSIVDHPSHPTAYTLNFESLGRTVSQTKTVAVTMADLSIAPSVPSVAPGDSVTLSWVVNSYDPAMTPVMITPMEEVSSAFDDISTLPGVAVIFGAGKDNEIVEHVFPAGFAFPFLGSNQTKVRVAVNGFLSFFSGIAAGYSSNFTIPSTISTDKNVHLAPFWDDLHTRTSGRVYAAEVGADYIIQWSHVSPLTGSSNTNEFDLNFQVVLHPDGSFEYRYGTMGPHGDHLGELLPGLVRKREQWIQRDHRVPAPVGNGGVPDSFRRFVERGHQQAAPWRAHRSFLEVHPASRERVDHGSID